MGAALGLRTNDPSGGFANRLRTAQDAFVVLAPTEN